jgi:GNAT superfamily N-acetyltransferase
MLTAQVETIAGALEEMKRLFHAHWSALALDKDEAPLDPQYEVYLDRERRGEALMVALRERGELMGYFIGFIAPGLHYRRTLTFTMDIFWVRENHRNRSGGLKLMRCLLRELKRRGVQRAFLGSKLHKDCGRLFEAFGFRPVETYYSLWMGD